MSKGGVGQNLMNGMVSRSELIVVTNFFLF